ncbi:MAG: DUF4388 domain-containing protein [Trueperaceae bacterium]|nr:MAG: DUF4388 domain-containing protein [Trueperaceae bacterium]
MTGTLGLFSLVDLFQLLSSASRTGRLLIEHPKGSARVYFDKGSVRHAEFGGLKGEEAVFALFADERGNFEFTVGLTPLDLTIELSTENLMLEAIRRLDEGRRGSIHVTISDEEIPMLTEGLGDTGKVTLHGHEVKVLRLVDGKKSIPQIAAAADLDIGEVRRIIDRMVKVGSLRMRSRKPRIARLVTRLAKGRLPSGVVGIDQNILNQWERTTGYPADHVACKRPSGEVDVYEVDPLEGAGPYIHVSHDTLMRTGLAVNIALLVQPVPRSQAE